MVVLDHRLVMGAVEQRRHLAPAAHARLAIGRLQVIVDRVQGDTQPPANGFRRIAEEEHANHLTLPRSQLITGRDHIGQLGRPGTLYHDRDPLPTPVAQDRSVQGEPASTGACQARPSQRLPVL